MTIRSTFLNQSNYLVYIIFLVSIIPVAFTGFLIISYSVDIPYWDQWAIAPLFAKIHTNSLSFNDLIAQHNESRKFFPRLIFICLAFITDWDIRYEILIIFLLACVISFNLYRLNALTIEGTLVKKLYITFITNLLIFAPIQWENWLWGIQIVVFIPIACITTGILITYSHISAKSKFWLLNCLCTVSTFSYANGIISWVVLFPVFFVKNKHEFNSRKWIIPSWITAFVVNAAVYFYNYKKPSHHPSFSEVFVHPKDAIHYFLSFLGAPLGLGSLILSPVVGFALILILLTSCVYLLKFASNKPLLINVFAWLTIVFYTLISAVITTSGRVGFGVQQSLSSRYTTFSVYLIIATIYIVVIIYDDLKIKLPNKSLNKIHIFKNVLVCMLLLLHLLTSLQAVTTMSQIRKDRLLAKSCLHFINVLPGDCLTKKIFPNLDQLTQYANDINKLNFLRPPLEKDSIIQENRNEDDVIQQNYGWFDNITKNGDGSYLASGWAVLPYRKEGADSVILTYEIAEDKFQMFALVSDVQFERYDVAKSLNQKSYINSGWRKSFFLPENTNDSLRLTAWGYDADTGKYFKLKGNHVVQK